MSFVFKKRLSKPSLVGQHGFTLIEIMVVVVIIAILAALVVPKIMSRPEQAKIVKAKQDVQSIQNALDLYRLDNGAYPSQAQGLQALISKPSGTPAPQNYAKGGYLKSLPQDPWGAPYQYQNPGQHGEVDVFTYGKAGKAGGTSNIIGNWVKQKGSANGSKAVTGQMPGS